MKQPLDHLRSRKKATYRRIALALDSAVLDERDRIKGEIAKVEMKAGLTGMSGKVNQRAQDELDELTLQLDEAEANLAEASAWFHVQSIGPKAWDKLVSQHPPTAQQRQQAKKDGVGALLYNPDTFLDALIVKCVSYVYRDPDDEDAEEILEPLTKEFLEEMREGDQWSAGEILQLAEVASEVNQQVRRVGDLGNASRQTT